MEREYWIRRKRAAIDMAQRAAGSEARLIHYQLAGLYSIRAAKNAHPFMLPNKGPATIGERDALLPPDVLRPRKRLRPKHDPKGEAA